VKLHSKRRDLAFLRLELAQPVPQFVFIHLVSFTSSGQ
jgi:hypothetical protein